MGERGEDMQEKTRGRNGNLGRCGKDWALMVRALPSEPPGHPTSAWIDVLLNSVMSVPHDGAKSKSGNLVLSEVGLKTWRWSGPPASMGAGNLTRLPALASGGRSAFPGGFSGLRTWWLKGTFSWFPAGLPWSGEAVSGGRMGREFWGWCGVLYWILVHYEYNNELIITIIVIIIIIIIITPFTVYK